MRNECNISGVKHSGGRSECLFRGFLRNCIYISSKSENLGEFSKKAVATGERERRLRHRDVSPTKPICVAR
jgi:hypothetical protein